MIDRLKNLIRNVNYLSKNSLWEQREKDIVYLTNKILDDSQYEYNILDDGLVKPVILNKESSFNLILNSGKSFVRTGDGEIKIMMGVDQPFQVYDQSLAEGLKNIISNPNSNLLVGLNRNYYIPGYISNFNDFYRRFGYDLRSFYNKIINPKITYFDSTITAYQFGTHNCESTKIIYNKWKDAFLNKNLLIVCGKGVIDNLKYDIFEYASHIDFIYGPSKNAWDSKDNLIQNIKEKAQEDTIIIFILGMAGKVIISELASEGYICWDVGHLAKYYDAFMNGMDNSDVSVRRFYSPDGE